MADRRRLAALSDAGFADALGALGSALAVPSPAPAGSPDLASRARSRIEAEGITPDSGWLDRLGLRPTGRPATRPLRRGLVLALAALLVLAAIAGAIGFGLPGLRIVFGPTATVSQSPSPSPTISASPAPIPSGAPTPTPTAGPPGSALGLGRMVSLADARTAVDFPILLPTDSRFGAPDVVWIDDVDRVTLIWLARPGVTTIAEPGISLIVSEFPGHLDEGYFQKILQSGTTIERVDVAGSVGYWISGEPHEFVYVGPAGEPVFESRRLVGDTLAWSVGNVTYRLETTLHREDALQVAESMH